MVRIEPVFSGSPVWRIFADSLAVIRTGPWLATGGQVTYRGSKPEHHGPFAVLGRCACQECVPDDPDKWEYFRLVIANGETEMTCVRPESVIART